jgi:hypothetical protein
MNFPTSLPRLRAAARAACSGPPFPSIPGRPEGYTFDVYNRACALCWAANYPKSVELLAAGLKLAEPVTTVAGYPGPFAADCIKTSEAL